MADPNISRTRTFSPGRDEQDELKSNRRTTMSTTEDKLSKMEGDLLMRAAYAERDSRESYRTIKVMIAAGFLTDEQYGEASRLVSDARDVDTFVDVDHIKRRILEDLKKQK